MVANNLLGFSNKLVILLDDLDFSFSRSSCSFGDNEKKATSDPEIKAEQSRSNTINNAAPTIPPVPGVANSGINNGMNK